MGLEQYTGPEEQHTIDIPQENTQSSGKRMTRGAEDPIAEDYLDRNLSPELSPAVKAVVDDLIRQAIKEDQASAGRNTNRKNFRENVMDNPVAGLVNIWESFVGGSKRRKQRKGSRKLSYEQISGENKLILTKGDIPLLKTMIEESASPTVQTYLSTFMSGQLDMLASKESTPEKSSLEKQAELGTFGVGDVIVLDSHLRTKTRWGSMMDRITGKTIKSITKSDYTHCAMISGVEPLKIIHVEQTGGVKEEDWSVYLARQSYSTIVVARGGGEKAVETARRNLNKPYSVKDIIQDELMGARQSDDSAFYCSELVLDALGADKKFLYPSDLLKISPPLYTTYNDTLPKKVTRYSGPSIPVAT